MFHKILLSVIYTWAANAITGLLFIIFPSTFIATMQCLLCYCSVSPLCAPATGYRAGFPCTPLTPCAMHCKVFKSRFESILMYVTPYLDSRCCCRFVVHHLHLCIHCHQTLPAVFLICFFLGCPHHRLQSIFPRHSIDPMCNSLKNLVVIKDYISWYEL